MQERYKRFTTLIADINRNIRKIKTEEMSEFNLKGVHVSCVYYLYKENSLTVKALCEVCDEDKANISRSIEYLEERGYVEKRPDTSKRYKAPVELSAEGREVGRIIAEKIDRILLDVSEGVSPEERETMYRILTAVNENLQKICDAYEKSGGEK